MEKTYAKDSQADVRILTLKRWNFPQTTQLFPAEGNSPTVAGDYISYNSHHIIHIEKCPQMEAHPIRCAYHSFESLRRHQRDSKDADIHTIQSMTLLGEDSKFWDTPGDVLYISFLQLTNSACPSIEEIRSTIDSTISSYAPDASWTLYYSLDFCDLVLFTKNLTYEDCSRTLWDLSIVRCKNLAILRDSFTIYGFRQEFLKDAFQKLKQSALPQWNDHASLSIQLSIQSYPVWDTFKNSLNAAQIPFSTLRTFGRYDVRLVTEDLPGSKILHLLYLLDTMAITPKSKDRSFGGYEISMEASWEKETTSTSTNTNSDQDRKLEDAATAAMDLLCKLCLDADSTPIDYADETRRSLEALLKNGFSEEYVLSVLSTFLGFLQITIDIENYRKHANLKDDQCARLKESQEKMTRHYFNAVNILALCTMHSERKFVQAPAFNAIYFDVPPKLLVFYSAVARQILNALKSNDDADYHFLFIPNYEKDINVRALELEMSKNLPHHLAVAHLHESYFYDPIFTIKLFCHEAAHYMSDRHRKVRVKHIFRAISFLLLSNTPVNSTLTEPTENSITAVLADSLADYMIEKFNEQTLYPSRGIRYHLLDVSTFLCKNNYGISFFTNTFDADRICDNWKTILREKVRKDPCTFGNLFADGLDKIQKTLQSDYLTKFFRQDSDNTYVYEVFSRIIANYAAFSNGESPSDNFGQICEHIINAFSEAYADLRMNELIGEEFSLQDYNTMLTELSDNSHYQLILRHDAVLKVMAPTESWESSIDNEEDFLVLSYAVEQIKQYLDVCHQHPISSSQVVHTLKEFKSGDVSRQWKHLREVTQQYRTYLTTYCQNILADPPTLE